MSATTRRTALGGAGITGLAGLIGATTTARAATASPDAALIRACNEMLALKAEFDALFDQRHTIADEEKTEPELMILYDRESEIQDRLCDQAAPSTSQGARALARLAVARWPIALEGELVAEDFDQWVSLSVIKYLAGDAIGA